MRTYADLIDHVSLVALGHGKAVSREQVRVAINTAYAGLPLLANWKRYQTTTRLTVQPTVSGSCEVTGQGTVTIAEGAWPTWAAGCTIRIAGTPCRVATRDTATQLTLATLPKTTGSGLSFVLYHDYHPLPDDFLNVISAHVLDYETELRAVTPSGAMQTYGVNFTPSVPQAYVVEAVLYGHALRIVPPPASGLLMDVVYRKRPAELIYSGHDERDTAGTISVNGNTVTGVNTLFARAMEGCVLRVGTPTRIPTGPEGNNPYIEERIIDSVQSPTELIVASDFDNNYTNVRYSVTDVLDIDEHLYQLLVGHATLRLSTMIGESIAVDVAGLLQEAKAADALQIGRTSSQMDRGVFLRRVITTYE